MEIIRGDEFDIATLSIIDTDKIEKEKYRGDINYHESSNTEEYDTLMAISNLVGVLRNRLTDLQNKLKRVYIKNHIQNKNIRKAITEFEAIISTLTKEFKRIYGLGFMVLTPSYRFILLSDLLYLPNTRNITFKPEVATVKPLIKDISTLPEDIKINILDTQDLYESFTLYVCEFIKTRFKGI